MELSKEIIVNPDGTWRFANSKDQPAGEAVAWQQRQRPDTNPVGALAHWCAISQQTYEECKDDPAFHLYEFRPLYAHPQFTPPTPADSAPLVECLRAYVAACKEQDIRLGPITGDAIAALAAYDASNEGRA